MDKIKTAASSFWGLAKVFATVWVFSQNVTEATISSGPSMLPTLKESQDILLASHLARHSKSWERGDVVISNSMTMPGTLVVKRIVGMPGEEIIVPSDSGLGPNRKVFVPRGHVFLLGDNASNSHDSRHYGPVPIAMLRSRVFVRIWPLSRAGFLPQNDNKYSLHDEIHIPHYQRILASPPPSPSSAYATASSSSSSSLTVIIDPPQQQQQHDDIDRCDWPKQTSKTIHVPIPQQPQQPRPEISSNAPIPPHPSAEPSQNAPRLPYSQSSAE